MRILGFGIILNVAKIFFSDEHGFSLVHWAAVCGKVDVLQLLKENKFDMKVSFFLNFFLTKIH